MADITISRDLGADGRIYLDKVDSALAEGWWKSDAGVYLPISCEGTEDTEQFAYIFWGHGNIQNMSGYIRRAFCFFEDPEAGWQVPLATPMSLDISYDSTVKAVVDSKEKKVIAGIEYPVQTCKVYEVEKGGNENNLTTLYFIMDYIPPKRNTIKYGFRMSRKKLL